MLTCKKHRACVRLYRNTGKVKLSGVYRACIGRRDGQKVWIVDGDVVARELYPEWIMGGNDQRYRFNPTDEIWLDDRIGSGELEYTLAHEVLERKLMREEAMSYNRAHDLALALEKVLRNRDERRAARAGRRLASLAAGGALGAELAATEPEKLGRIYRSLYGTAGGARHWVVDGPLVRSLLAPNFCFGANGKMETWIPGDEIWLDSAMSSLETYFTVFRQKIEYRHLAAGSRQSRAYELGLIEQLDERERQVALCRAHEALLPPVRYGARDRGVKPGKI